jgi:hypothetical protein
MTVVFGTQTCQINHLYSIFHPTIDTSHVIMKNPIYIIVEKFSLLTNSIKIILFQISRYVLHTAISGSSTGLL